MQKKHQHVRRYLVVQITLVIADDARIERRPVQFAAHSLGQHKPPLDQLSGRFHARASRFLPALCGRRAARIQVPPQPLQVASHSRRGLVAKITVLLQRFCDEVFQCDRNFRVQPDGRSAGAMKNGSENGPGRSAPKRRRPRRHFIQHDAERIQIGARVQHFSPHLLRRHVGGRSQCAARTGEMQRVARVRDGLAHAPVVCRSTGSGHLGQAKIKNFCAPAPRDKNVRRLDVAMHDPGAMRHVERVRNLSRQRDQVAHLHRPSRQVTLQSQARQKFHDDECLAVLLADVVDGADVGMVQR